MAASIAKAKSTSTPGSTAKISETERPKPSDAAGPSPDCLVTSGIYSIWKRRLPQTGYVLRRNAAELDTYPSLEGACAQMAWLIELNDGGHLERLYKAASAAEDECQTPESLSA